MARKIRFPMKMKNGVEVRTLEELKENFDLESVLSYFTDGKLVTWLADRYYDEKAEAVSALSAHMPDLNAMLCAILEVEYKAEEDETDLENIQRRNEKYKMLSLITDNQEVLNNIDLVATDQDELFDILDENPKKVYLYGEKYSIPFGVKSICYVGLNEPLVLLEKNKQYCDYEQAGIEFISVKFEEGVKPVEIKLSPNLPSIGETIKFGKYEWYVIGMENDCCKLLLKTFLPNMPYHNEAIDVTWENCSLRKWLNTSFYNQFNDDDKKRIVKTHCPACNNDVNILNQQMIPAYEILIKARALTPADVVLAGNATDDYVYLLSIDEASNIDNSILSDSESSWWLRTPGESQIYASYMKWDGSICREGIFVVFEQIAVRPALNVRFT